MPTASQLSPQEIAAYQDAAHQRHLAAQHELRRREQHAWQLARQAATLLRTQFNASRVVVFGSLLHTNMFHEWSDIDLAAWGVHAHDTLRAIGMVMDLTSTIQINLVDITTATPRLRATIEREGVDL